MNLKPCAINSPGHSIVPLDLSKGNYKQNKRSSNKPVRSTNLLGTPHSSHSCCGHTEPYRRQYFQLEQSPPWRHIYVSALSVRLGQQFWCAYFASTFASIWSERKKKKNTILLYDLLPFLSFEIHANFFPRKKKQQQNDYNQLLQHNEGVFMSIPTPKSELVLNRVRNIFNEAGEISGNYKKTFKLL